MLAPPTIRIWSWLHRWTSLVCTAFLLLLCVTGLPLIFHDEIDGAFDDEAAVAARAGSAREADLDLIVQTGRQHDPQAYIRSVLWDEDHPHVIKLFMAQGPDSPPGPADHSMVFDAGTGKLLDERRPERGFMAVMLELHEELLLGLPGELFLGLMGLLFAASIMSGVVVYGPFMRKLEFGTVRRDRSSRVKWLDLHNLIGIATLTWGLVVGATGVMNTLSTPLFGLWRAQALPALLAPYRGEPMLDPSEFRSVNKAVAQARARLPGNEVTSVVFPSTRFGSPRHYVIWTKGRSAITSRLFTPVLIDVQTGRVSLAAGLPWYLRLLEMSRPLHFGDYGGLPLKILWALLDGFTIAVLGSGLYLWIARGKVAHDGRIGEAERVGAAVMPPSGAGGQE